MKVLWAFALIVVVGVVALQFGLGGLLPFVSIAVSFHTLAALIGAFVVGIALVIALVRRRLRVQLLVTFITAVAIFAAAIYSTPATSDATTHTSDGVRVLEWNVAQDGVGAAAILALIQRTKPDFVVLAELYEGNLPRVAGWRTPAGYEAIGTRDIAVTVLVAKKLGTYTAVDPDESGATSGFVAQPSQAGSPRIVAAHLSRQTSAGDQHGWRTGLEWISRQCDQPNAIVVGDLNTTGLNLRRIGNCTFASQPAAPSWPTWLPAKLGASIDNVLTTKDWRVDSLQTFGELDRSGSDHRPIFAVFSR